MTIVSAHCHYYIHIKDGRIQTVANTQRRAEFMDRTGKRMMIPTNVEGGNYSEHFITTPKLACMVGMLLALVLILAALSDMNPPATTKTYVFYVGGWAIASFYLTRYVILEEKYYFKLYNNFKQYSITTPALFWNIASSRDTDDGAILSYANGKIGIVVQVDKDTITGKPPGFEEIHYDALSDFYKALLDRGYSFVQMNLMEKAGNDPRIPELNKLMANNKNSSIQKLMELEVGHIKNITNITLYESEYYLIYKNDMSAVDTIQSEVADCLMTLLGGAYVGYRYLNSKEIANLVKERHGVTYFNVTEASVMLFGLSQNAATKPFSLSGIIWDDNQEQELTQNEINTLRNLTLDIMREKKSIHDVDIRDIVYRRDTKHNVGIDLDSTLDASREFMEMKAKKQARNKPAVRHPVNTKKKQEETLFKKPEQKQSVFESEEVKKLLGENENDTVVNSVDNSDIGVDLDAILGVNSNDTPSTTSVSENIDFMNDDDIIENDYIPEGKDTDTTDNSYNSDDIIDF